MPIPKPKRIPALDLHRFLDAAKDIFDTPDETATREVFVFVSAVRSSGFDEAVAKLPIRIDPSLPPLELVDAIAAALSAHAGGGKQEILCKSLQEAILESSGLDYDLGALDPRSRLSNFLRQNGSSSFMELFLSIYLFNLIWIQIQEAVRWSLKDENSFRAFMESFSRACRNVVKAALAEQAGAQKDIRQVMTDIQRSLLPLER